MCSKQCLKIHEAKADRIEGEINNLIITWDFNIPLYMMARKTSLKMSIEIEGINTKNQADVGIKL